MSSARPSPSIASPACVARPVPPNISAVLLVLRVLLAYGRHLSATLEHRATARGFSVIAQFFGTASVPPILARVSRGILRAMLLQRILLVRAQRGRDLAILPQRQYITRPAQSASPPAGAAVLPSPTAPPRLIRHSDPDFVPGPLTLPMLPQLEAQLRRRPIGRTVADICRDLGVSPSLCEGRFWNAVFSAITCYRGSLPRLMKDFRRHEVGFEKELDRNPSLGWPEIKRDAIRRALGFFIGEPPLLPFAPAAPPGLAAVSMTVPP